MGFPASPRNENGEDHRCPVGWIEPRDSRECEVTPCPTALQRHQNDEAGNDKEELDTVVPQGDVERHRRGPTHVAADMTRVVEENNHYGRDAAKNVKLEEAGDLHGDGGSLKDGGGSDNE